MARLGRRGHRRRLPLIRIVAVDYRKRHPLYRKTMTRTHRFAAHDEDNRCEIGDTVEIEESRPLSKTKRWVVREILERKERA